MDLSVTNLVLYLTATFAAALVTGIAGFAFGLIATAVWLYILTPLQTATLIVGFGLVVQGVSVWKLRHALKWSGFEPFLIGGARRAAGRCHSRMGKSELIFCDVVGAILIAYSIYGLARPTIKISGAGAPIDASVGFLNGVLGGLTRSAGILTTMWCGMRAWPKDEQRAVFQPIGVAIFAMSAFWLGAKGAISTKTIWLFTIGLPVLLAGRWLCLGALTEKSLTKTDFAGSCSCCY